MGTHGVVVTPPALDHDLSLLQGVEDLAVEQLVAQARIEALDIAGVSPALEQEFDRAAETAERATNPR